MISYNTPGHVCPDTRRIALSLSEFFALPVAMPGFIYNAALAKSGRDPWQPLDGIRLHTEDGGADVSFHEGIEPMILSAEQFASQCVYVAADAPVPALEEIGAAAIGRSRKN
jgi:hypothetical protein